MIDTSTLRNLIGRFGELLALVGAGATAYLFAAGNEALTNGGIIAGVLLVGWGLFLSPMATLPLPMLPCYVVKGVVYLWAAVVWGLLMPLLVLVLVVAVLVGEPELYRRRVDELDAR